MSRAFTRVNQCQKRREEGGFLKVPWLLQAFYDAMRQGQRSRHEFLRAIEVFSSFAINMRRDCKPVTGAFHQRRERAGADDPCNVDKMRIRIRRSGTTNSYEERNVRCMS